MLSLKVSKRWFNFFLSRTKTDKKKQYPSSPVVVRGAVNVDYLIYTWIPSILSSLLQIWQEKTEKIIMKVSELFFVRI